MTMALTVQVFKILGLWLAKRVLIRIRCDLAGGVSLWVFETSKAYVRPNVSASHLWIRCKLSARVTMPASLLPTAMAMDLASVSKPPLSFLWKLPWSWCFNNGEVIRTDPKSDSLRLMYLITRAFGLASDGFVESGFSIPVSANYSMG